jgi:hypothetical protein
MMLTSNACLWREEYGDEEYQTSCGKAFVLNDGTPKDNDMLFCCFCGKLLREERGASEPEEEEDAG